MHNAEWCVCETRRTSAVIGPSIRDGSLDDFERRFVVAEQLVATLLVVTR
jgi:hypothetical protein